MSIIATELKINLNKYLLMAEKFCKKNVIFFGLIGKTVYYARIPMLY